MGEIKVEHVLLFLVGAFLVYHMMGKCGRVEGLDCPTKKGGGGELVLTGCKDKAYATKGGADFNCKKFWEYHVLSDNKVCDGPAKKVGNSWRCTANSECKDTS
jgi:hypothetical protein